MLFGFIVVVLVAIIVVKSQIYVEIERIKGESLEESLKQLNTLLSNPHRSGIRSPKSSYDDPTDTHIPAIRPLLIAKHQQLNKRILNVLKPNQCPKNRPHKYALGPFSNRQTNFHSTPITASTFSSSCTGWWFF